MRIPYTHGKCQNYNERVDSGKWQVASGKWQVASTSTSTSTKLLEPVILFRHFLNNLKIKKTERLFVKICLSHEA